MFALLSLLPALHLMGGQSLTELLVLSSLLGWLFKIYSNGGVLIIINFLLLLLVVRLLLLL